ncbi:26S proteasome regulatory complex [Volvox carteri f. nagariensis]|uniref:26S proteasome non-ATPase regulatory subunit 2 homolog n=1 Tax=Volvox carteri f. nagariensis TaxID=3068 RepID=D8UK02_VOLCA|nr:26S proteasome regulatory complex [Volvox carteri f. nagariensis]EFJ39963.1 26S proteasome regulatory complex [Volvox carteri f. nagariensis]|eukprot:XP_002958988.1 26S proteasome regulatory complex [Volvox carteri f. nagariensis]
MVAPSDDKPKGKGAKEDKKGAKGKDEEKEPELSEEDLTLKNNLDLTVERLGDPDPGVVKLALTTMLSEIRSATASMTSVPKPLKFLRPHYDAMKTRLESMPAEQGENRAMLADVISILATTKELAREVLKYRLLGSTTDLGTWGHEYIRHLSGEIAEEFRVRREADSAAAVDDLMTLVKQIVPYNMTHNAEPEAVDLLLEVESLDLLESHVDEKNFGRTCLYLTSCCAYLPEPDDAAVLRLALRIYSSQQRWHDALRVALRLNSRGDVEGVFAACSEPLTKQQLGYLLARHGFSINLEEGPAAVEDDSLRESLREIISNSKLSEHFLALARDLDVMEAKTPEDVYKTHLTEGRAPAGAAAVDSARANLAATFVNAFVNAGFGQDKLVTVGSGAETGTFSVHWIFKNKDHGKISATASLGMVTLWDVEGGLPQIDKYLYSSDPYVVSGALLAIGVVNACVQNENDPAFALIADYVSNSDVNIRTGAILGLGLAYAGTGREEVSELLGPLVVDSDAPVEVSAFAALALGLVFNSSAREDVVMSVLQALMSRSDAELSTPYAKLMCLSLGLMFLGKQELAEATVEVVKTLSERISQFAVVTLESCAYAGTGNVLKVQGLLAMCGEHITADESSTHKTIHQGAAVLGLALLAMAEPLGSQMAGRVLEHLLQYGDAPARRAVPLAIALLHISNPDVLVMDTLSRLSHDQDSEVANNAIVGLGLLGAGTNNARLAGLLRGLASYYYKEPTALFLVRLAQGLVHMGKGLLTINPYHTDRQLCSGVSLAGVLAVLFSCLDLKATLCGKHHYLLYCLATAMKPRMLLTLDAEGRPLPVSCRVGTAVDVVAQAGRPKTITGFQTHTTPVLLGVGERAELATEEWLPLSPILEGQVILTKNPDYVAMDEGK